MGPEVAQLEDELAGYVGGGECVSCSSGTDALVMVLMALEIGRGDAVLVPSFTFGATAEAIMLVGATPVFVDVRGATFDIDVADLERGVESATSAGAHPAAIIGVDLFGLPADWRSLRSFAADHGMKLIADAAQSFGASTPDGRVGTLAPVTTTSFFPAKPLGCYGDGGAIFTADLGLASILRSIRVHGQGTSKYDTVRIGVNGRLDTIQAAILLEKLKVFDAELEQRHSIARRYSAALHNQASVPEVPGGFRSSWAQYTVRVPDRDRIAAALHSLGIPTAVYYSKPVHLQGPYRRAPRSQRELSTSAALARDVLSLPIHPYLSTDDQEFVINNFLETAQ